MTPRCLAFLMLVLAGPALAQTMYRCGSVYQDRPCGGVQEGRVVGRGAPAAEAAASQPRVDAQCARQGEQALRIMWRREAGQTEREQLAAPANAGQAELVSDVYQRRGSAPEVRAAVQADCMAEKARLSQAAALEQAASQLRGAARR